MTVNNATIRDAHALSGEYLLTKMDTDAQYHYVSGILEGLGYSRFLRDKPSEDGLKCIQGWLLKDGAARWQIVEQWLDHHKEKQAGVIINAIVSKECGK